MKSEAMSRLISKLQNSFNFLDVTALEFFAREGDWHTQDYANKVKSLHAWEINPAHKEKLKKNVPFASIEIGDSYELARRSYYKGIFQMVVLDNPQNLFGTNHFCEHFEALPLVKELLSPGRECLLIFNVNIKPFDYDLSPNWQERRFEYYGKDASSISLDFAEKFYIEKLLTLGLITNVSFFEPRDPNYLYYFAAVVKSIS